MKQNEHFQNSIKKSKADHFKRLINEQSPGKTDKRGDVTQNLKNEKWDTTTNPTNICIKFSEQFYAIMFDILDEMDKSTQEEIENLNIPSLINVSL